MSKYLRATAAYNSDSEISVDSNRAILSGVSVFQTGVVALGHGVMGDEITAAQLVKIGNARASGIKSRFAHPGMSEDGTGRQVAQARNFRVVNDKVIADMHFLQSARKSPSFQNDPVEYLISFAEESPEDMGLSIVFGGTEVWIDEVGTEVDVRDFDDRFTPVNDIPIVRVNYFGAADFVDSPAANRDGMFSTSLSSGMFAGYSGEIASEMFAALDGLIEQNGFTLEKAERFATRYFASRNRAEEKALARCNNLRPLQLPYSEALRVLSTTG